VLNEDFKEELRHARAEKNKKERLKKLFDKWGHVFATEVILGAERQLTTEATNINDKTENHVKNQLGIALHSSAPIPPLDLKSAAGWSRDQTEAYNHAINRTESCFIGGQSEHHGDDSLEVWRKSVETRQLSLPLHSSTNVSKAGNWLVIRRNKIIPIVDLLPRDVQDEIRYAAGKPLQGRWIYSQIESM
jgi:hypothetical protein